MVPATRIAPRFWFDPQAEEAAPFNVGRRSGARHLVEA